MGNSTTYKAPKLHHNGDKAQHNEATNQSYIIPQKLADIIFNELGNSSAQLRIMMVLCGTKEGFYVSNEWMEQRTGLSQQSYSNALKPLVKRGWITHKAYNHITINYDAIFATVKNDDE